MTSLKPAPILSLSSATMGQIDAWNPESLASLWTVFSKCAESLENGRRLENLSWRLWNRELLYCCDDSIFLVEDLTDGTNTAKTSAGATPVNSVHARHTLHPQRPPPDDLLKSLSELSVKDEDDKHDKVNQKENHHDNNLENNNNHNNELDMTFPPTLSSSVSSTDFSDEEVPPLATHVDSSHRSALSSLHSSRSNRSNLASSASTPTLSTTTATPAASRISSPPTLRTLVNSNDANSRPTIRRGNKSISDYRSLYRKRPSMKRKRLSAEKLHELMQLFRPVGQEVEYWQSLREERRRKREEEGEFSEASDVTNDSHDAHVHSVSMLPKEVLTKEELTEKREKAASKAEASKTEASKTEASKTDKDSMDMVEKDKKDTAKESKTAKETDTRELVKEKSSKDISALSKEPFHKSLAPTFFARSRRSSSRSRHRDSFNREKPALTAPRAQQPQPKVSSLFRRNTSVSSGSGSSAQLPSASAVADSDSYEDDESDFTDETDEDDVEEEAQEPAEGNLRRSDTSTSIVRGFSPSKTSVSFLGRSHESPVNGTNPATTFQQVPRQKQKMFFIESSPSESDGFGESVSKSDCSFSPLKSVSGSHQAASKSSLVDKSVEKPKVKHVSVQSPPKLDSTKYDDYYNDDDDDSDWDSVESDGSSVNEEPTFSREENLSGHNLVRPSLLSSMFLNNPDKLQEQIQQSKDKSRIFSKGMIPDESNSVSSKLGSMFSGQAKRVNTYTNLSEANYIVENGGLNSDGEDIARDNTSVARSLGAKSANKSANATTSKNNSVADLSRLPGAGPTPATVLSATPVAVATHEPVYGSILPSDVVRHSMLASEMSQSVQKSLMDQSELERRNLEALKRRHTSIDLKKMGEVQEDEPADFDYHARGW